MPKHEMEQAGVLFGGAIGLLAELIKADELNAHTYPPNVAIIIGGSQTKVKRKRGKRAEKDA